MMSHVGQTITASAAPSALDKKGLAFVTVAVTTSVAATVQVQVSENNSTFTTLATTASGTSHVFNDQIASRYVKLVPSTGTITGTVSAEG